MSEGYVIHAKDPGGEFVEARWRTPFFPRIGEHVMLPTDPAGLAWQEMSVEQVEHHPGTAEVWLGGTDGWDPGSVSDLFANARAFFRSPSGVDDDV